MALPDLMVYSADSTMEQEEATVSATLSSTIPSPTSWFEISTVGAPSKTVWYFFFANSCLITSATFLCGL